MDWFNRKKKQLKTLNKKNLETFLKQVSTSVDETFSGQDSEKLQKEIEKEFDNWLSKTIFSDQPLDPEGVKIGVCLGLMEALRKINEAERKESTPNYIS